MTVADIDRIYRDQEIAWKREIRERRVGLLLLAVGLGMFWTIVVSVIEELSK